MSANTTHTTGSSLCAETKKTLRLLGHQFRLLESDSLTLDELSRCNERQNPFENAAQAYSSQIEKLLKYFRDRWRLSCSDEEFGGIFVPRPQGYCKTILIVHADLTGPEDIFGKWTTEQKFSVCKYTDKLLNDVVPNDRRRLGHYALLHSGRQVADEELKEKSWETNVRDRRETMRLTEALLFEDMFFTETQEHIDPETATLTSSRYSDGGVASVCWYRGNREVSVHWYRPQYAYPGLRARAVSL